MQDVEPEIDMVIALSACFHSATQFPFGLVQRYIVAVLLATKCDGEACKPASNNGNMHSSTP